MDIHSPLYPSPIIWRANEDLCGYPLKHISINGTLDSRVTIEDGHTCKVKKEFSLIQPLKSGLWRGAYKLEGS